MQGEVGSFDVISETLRATNLGQLQADSEVNFERYVKSPTVLNGFRQSRTGSSALSCCCRSAKVGDEIGGHNVSGHVHTTAKIVSIEDTENNKRISFEVSVYQRQYSTIDNTSQLRLTESTTFRNEPRVPNGSGLQVDSRWLRYILPKGFIAVEGISLTVSEWTIRNVLADLTHFRELGPTSCHAILGWRSGEKWVLRIPYPRDAEGHNTWRKATGISRQH